MKKIKYFWRFEGILLLTILFSLSLSILIYITFQKNSFNNYVNEQIDSTSTRIIEKLKTIEDETHQSSEKVFLCVEEEIKYLNKLGIPLFFIVFQNDVPVSTNLNFEIGEFPCSEKTTKTLQEVRLLNKNYLYKEFVISPHTERHWKVTILYPEHKFIEEVQNGITYIILSQILLILFGTIWVILISNSLEKTIKDISLLLQNSKDNFAVNKDLYFNTSPEFSSLLDTFEQISRSYMEGNETRKAKEKLEQELQIAHQIQDAFLTKSIPEFRDCEIVAYYDFAKEIGGDYYDVLHVDDEKVAIAIADVSGKGVPGSLIMVMIRSILRAEAFGKESPLSL
ncbi:MAG TPA: hypothetical protein ENN73_01140, partial [Firmicutes bacterium]|nr:hypothetical protein [Bacillota bacterium]